MSRVAKGIQERNGDALRLASHKLLHKLFIFIKSRASQNSSTIIEAFRQFQPPFSWDERWKSLLHDVIKRGTILATYLEHISKTLGRNKHSASAFALQ